MDQDAPSRLLIWSEYLDALYEAKRVLDRLAELRPDSRITSRVVTGKTPKKERQHILETWGLEFRILLTAKVAEEGLNAPQCAHGIVIAGARTSRQAMQRLGRLLRPLPGKIAKIWLIFNERTIEERLINVVDKVSDE